MNPLLPTAAVDLLSVICTRYERRLFQLGDRYAKILLIMNLYYKILVASYGISTFTEGIMMPIYAIFVQKVGGSILDASGAVATYYITQAVIEIWLHKQPWSHKYRMHLMIIGWFIWLMGIVTYLNIQSVEMLFLAQIFTGMGNAVANPAFDAELAEHTDRGHKEFEWAAFEGLQDIFSGIAAIAGGLVATAFGFNILIIVMVITGTLSFGLALNYMHIRKVALRNNNFGAGHS